MNKTRLLDCIAFFMVFTSFMIVPQSAKAQNIKLTTAYKIVKDLNSKPNIKIEPPYSQTYPNIKIDNQNYQNNNISTGVDSIVNTDVLPRITVFENEYKRLCTAIEQDSIMSQGYSLLVFGHIAHNLGNDRISTECLNKYRTRYSYDIYDLSRYKSWQKNVEQDSSFRFDYQTKVYENNIIYIIEKIHSSAIKNISINTKTYPTSTIIWYYREFSAMPIKMMLDNILEAKDGYEKFEALVNSTLYFINNNLLSKETAKICQDYLAEATFEYAMHQETIHQKLLDIFDGVFFDYTKNDIRKIFILYVISSVNNDNRKDKYEQLGHNVDSSTFSYLLNKYNKQLVEQE